MDLDSWNAESGPKSIVRGVCCAVEADPGFEDYGCGGGVGS